MNNPKLSVIIPVYNAEFTIRRCLDSIQQQTFTDWECILVNDGSPDGSGSICDKYAQKDSRFRVLHKENGGVSSARNLGLDHAKGEWITFVDADDFISSNYFDDVEKYNSDIIVFERMDYGVDNKCFNHSKLKESKSSNCHEYKQILTDIIYERLLKVPWGKLFRTSCIGDVKFLIGQNLGEDTVFVFQVYKNCSSIQVVKGPTYYWQQDNTDSKKKYCLDPEMAALFLNRIYEAYKCLDIKAPIVERLELNCFFEIVSKTDRRRLRKFWFANPIIQKIESHVLPHYHNDYYNIWKDHIYIAPYIIICKRLLRVPQKILSIICKKN